MAIGVPGTSLLPGLTGVLSEMARNAWNDAAA
jgi:hypothetical protein